MKSYLSVGPPVYFVVKDTNFNYSDHFQQDLLRSGDNYNSNNYTMYYETKCLKMD